MQTGLRLQEGCLCWMCQTCSSSMYRHELHLPVSTVLWAYTPETTGWQLQWHAKIWGTVCHMAFEKPAAVLLLATAFLISWRPLLLVTQEGCQRVAGADTFVVHRWQVHFLPSQKTTCKSHKSLKLHMIPDLWTDGWIPAQRDEQALKGELTDRTLLPSCAQVPPCYFRDTGELGTSQISSGSFVSFSGKIGLWLRQRLTSIWPSQSKHAGAQAGDGTVLLSHSFGKELWSGHMYFSRPQLCRISSSTSEHTHNGRLLTPYKLQIFRQSCIDFNIQTSHHSYMNNESVLCYFPK